MSSLWKKSYYIFKVIDDDDFEYIYNHYNCGPSTSSGFTAIQSQAIICFYSDKEDKITTQENCYFLSKWQCCSWDMQALQYLGTLCEGRPPDTHTQSSPPSLHILPTMKFPNSACDFGFRTFSEEKCDSSTCTHNYQRTFPGSFSTT